MGGTCVQGSLVDRFSDAEKLIINSQQSQSILLWKYHPQFANVQPDKQADSWINPGDKLRTGYRNISLFLFEISLNWVIRDKLGIRKRVNRIKQHWRQ